MKSKINVVSFANGRFIKSQKVLEEKSYQLGADRVFSYGPNDIESNFIKKNKKAFSSPRGAGYWVWKPYVILKALKQIQEEEILIYLDSGCYPVEDLKLLPSDKSVNCFEMYEMKNKTWTKYDCFYLMNCLEDKYLNANQKVGGFQIYRKDKISIQFVEEYLYFCELEENTCITDEPNKYGNNFDGFIENRHDQSVFANLCVKYNTDIHRDPSQWGLPFKEKYTDSYPQLFNLHRGVI